MGVIIRKDDVHETTIKENNDDECSSDGVVLRLVRRQNRDTIECGESN
jgi:hypothetical protein